MGINSTFNWEELPADLVLGAVNAGTAALSFPAATRAAIASGEARIGILRQVAGSSFVGGASAGGIASALSDDTWQHGFTTGVLHVTQAALLGGSLGAALPLTMGATLYGVQRTGLAALTQRFVSGTTATTASIVDSSLLATVRLLRATGQTVREAVEFVLSPQRLDDIALYLVGRPATETLESFRLGVRNLLSDLQGPRLAYAEAAIMDVVESSRNEFGSLGQSGVRLRVGEGLERLFASVADGVESIRMRFRIAGAPASHDLAEAIAARLSTLPENATETEIRAALAEVLPAGTTISDDLVRITREFLTPELLPPGSAGSAQHKALRWQEYQQRGGAWTYERWSRTYDQNMVRARAANVVADEYHATLGWGLREQTVNAGGVPRRLDIVDEALNRAVEVKSGYTCLSEDILWEVLRDRHLVTEGWTITWHFEGTASQPLLRALDDAGIQYTGALIR